MFDLDISVPGWMAPLVIVCIAFSMTFPLALLLLVSSQAKRGAAHFARLAWVVLSGAFWVYCGLQFGWRGILGVLSYSFPLAILVLAVRWRRGDSRARRATIFWVAISGIPLVWASFRDLGGL